MSIAVNSFLAPGSPYNASLLNKAVSKRKEHPVSSSKASKQNGIESTQSASLDALVSAVKGAVDTSGMLHPALKRLADYDRENQADFLHTLQIYLDNDCNAQKCGRLLFLHRNSLVYRIRRIQEVGHCDLSDPEERAFLRLSFLLK